MGMFDYVAHEESCPTCAEPMREWQTKDRDAPFLELLQPGEVENFYTFCDKCWTWVEYQRDDDAGDHTVGGQRWRRVVELNDEVSP